MCQIVSVLFETFFVIMTLNQIEGPIMNEKILIYQIKHGNQQALDKLISRYYPDIYRYIFLKLHRKEDAEDVAQEVFLRFIRQIPTYHHRDKLLNYLYTIAYSCCMDYFRKQKPFEDFLDYENQISDPVNVHSFILQQIQAEQIQLLLKKLSFKEQDVIIFHLYQQMTFKEIAQILNMPEQTIKSCFYRALKKLRILWKEENHETANSHF